VSQAGLRLVLGFLNRPNNPRLACVFALLAKRRLHYPIYRRCLTLIEVGGDSAHLPT